MEADFVCHCGETMSGSFVHTLVLTDVATGWTECIALAAREQHLVTEALDGLRKQPRNLFRIAPFSQQNNHLASIQADKLIRT